MTGNATTVNISSDDPKPGENRSIFQGFEWYLPVNIPQLTQHASSGVLKDQLVTHWTSLTLLLPELKALGITSIWIPPACKASNPMDNGYAIYDLYDLGEFDAKGSVATKWGTKQELQRLCEEARKQGIGIIFDAVLNHRAAADASEEMEAVRVDFQDRTKEVDKRPSTIVGWTKFNYDARRGKYSRLKYNKDHFSGIDWDDKAKQKSIYKLVGTRSDGSKKGWAQDVARSENGNYDYLMCADVDFGSSEVREDVKNWGRWLLEELPGVSGIRLDAIKHYSAGFQKEFLDHVKQAADAEGGDFFLVGEYWLQNSRGLSKHIDKTFGGQLHMFDVKLLYNFHNISTGLIKDLRYVFSGSLVELQPNRAVTFVTNHDTQEEQSLAAPVEPWFIPHAYTLILLRRAGHPCVFWGDVFGTSGPQPRLPACGGRLMRLVKARQLFAYGEQTDDSSSISSAMKSLLNPKDITCIAWQRQWRHDTHGPISLVVLISISWSWKKKRVRVPKECAGQIYTDLMGFCWSGVQIDKDGFGEFVVGPRSISVWTWNDAPGRSEVDNLVYPAEPSLQPPLEADTTAADDPTSL
ncbi:hypothetical protein PMZ80_010721 [Knufia obscura]|uniref:Glycosyl hydrolase family 13 catalytic domain-containing protein n=1 Tax=Knufia obscura TaxID=1635080 RepID=A0ABR0R8N6_9EURO|nr:hypothetical protein PMZ80_010721 [Knufia obscura]